MVNYLLGKITNAHTQQGVSTYYREKVSLQGKPW